MDGEGRAISAGRDLALADRLGRLYTGVVSDALDRLGIRGRVMAPRIRPLYPAAKASGYAATVSCVQVDGPPERHEDWYRGELEAVDALVPGDVIVVSTCAGCYWGELLATAARHRGARGIVADAFTRDTLALIEMAFPTFVAGISPEDSLGRIEVAETGAAVECGGVVVRPGDLVLADHDGVVVVPGEAGHEVVERAEEKIRAEDAVRAELARGLPVAEAFRRYGVI